MRFRWSVLSLLAVCVLAQGCCKSVFGSDKDKEEDADLSEGMDQSLTGTIEEKDFDLKGIGQLVQDNKVTSASALEGKINEPDSGLSKVDSDKDGKPDKIAVIEVRKPEEEKTNFEFYAVPSSKPKSETKIKLAVLAFLTVKADKVVKVKASYTPIIKAKTHVVLSYSEPIQIKNNVVISSKHPHGYIAWVHTPRRPVYVSVNIVNVHIHGDKRDTVVVEHHYTKHKKHKKWKKHKKH
jgi:rRNA processing protein Gar1